MKNRGEKSLVPSDTFMPPLQPDHVVVTELFVAGAHDPSCLVLHYPAGAVSLPLLLLIAVRLVVAPVMFWLSTQVVLLGTAGVV